MATANGFFQLRADRHDGHQLMARVDRGHAARCSSSSHSVSSCSSRSPASRSTSAGRLPSAGTCRPRRTPPRWRRAVRSSTGPRTTPRRRPRATSRTSTSTDHPRGRPQRSLRTTLGSTRTGTAATPSTSERDHRRGRNRARRHQLGRRHDARPRGRDRHARDRRSRPLQPPGLPRRADRRSPLHEPARPGRRLHRLRGHGRHERDRGRSTTRTRSGTAAASRPASRSRAPSFELYGPGAKANNDASFRGFIALDVRNFESTGSRVYYNGVTAGNEREHAEEHAGRVHPGRLSRAPAFPAISVPPAATRRSA